MRHRYTVHPPEHRILVAVPAIISRDVWEAAQKALKAHSRGGQPPKNHYLLKGRVLCIKTHANMIGQTVTKNGKKYSYYFRPHRFPALRRDYAARCHVPQLRQSWLEDWVWSTVMALAEHPERIAAEIQRSHEEAEKAQRLTRQAIAGLEAEIVRLKSQKAVLLDLYLNQDKQGLVLTQEEYQAKANDIAQQIAKIEAQLLEIQERVKQYTITPQ